MDAPDSVFLGLDVGKGEHHAVAVDADGKRPHDAPLPNSEDTLRELFDRPARHRRLLVVGRHHPHDPPTHPPTKIKKRH
ncbi:transposase [Saccharopolyspora erythraea NRRL 2338]|uniref:Transposase IS110-like N-terminal domain-containing protein n=1 Tax=Saccharopolyspora erythraea TaxID=1836 RepID=A0ABP3NU73_SACER|nr:transposase [Saccharopolyspora erythraea NRRL 2338]